MADIAAVKRLNSWKNLFILLLQTTIHVISCLTYG